jgi:hypothetical protein
MLLVISLAQGVAAASVIVSCPFGSSGGDDITRAFYVTSYPGSNLATVRLEYDANPAGMYTISLTARLGAFNGPIIGSTQTVTVNLPSTSSEASVTFDFGGAPVTPGSTVTFTQAKVAGPGTAYFNKGIGPCSHVVETEGTSPPLDTTRGNSVGLEISQLTTPSTDWAITSLSMIPPTPQAGQPVTFKATLVAVSTSGSYPQSVFVECTVDGSPCGSGNINYPGPTGIPETVTAASAWMATPGTHTVTWSASAVGDPNPSNNLMSTTFAVVPQAPFDFSISASPTGLGIAPGGTGSYVVTVNSVSGGPQSVALSLSGAPPGVSASFSPPSGTPPFSSTLSVTSTSSVSPGAITLTITGSGGGTVHTTQVTLTISQAPDFTIDASPPSQNVLAGGTTSYLIHVGSSNGFNSAVSLAVSGAPSGANAVLSTTSATPDFDSTLTVALPTNALPGTFTLTVTGSGGGLSHQVNLVLTISPGQPTQTTSQSSTTSTTPSNQISSPAGLLNMLQEQGNLLLLGIGVIVILLLLLIALRGRRKPTPASGASSAGKVYCAKCGTPNAATNEYCGKCGNKLR